MSTSDGGEIRWSAYPPAGHDDEGSRPVKLHVAGTQIRFMCDYGVVIPLWDEDGPLPDDAEWLSQELGLSSELVADLADWASGWDSAEPGDPKTRREWIDRHREFTERGLRLFERVRSESLLGFEVVNRER